VSEIDLAEVATHADLIVCLDRLYIRADSPSYRNLQQQTAKRSGSQFPGTRLERVRLGRSAIGELLGGSTFPRKAFLLTFVEACGVDVAADRRWEQAWDRLSERYAKRAGQAQTELAELREEVARLHAEAAAWQLAAKKAQAEEADLRTQLAAAAQNAEKARLEALHQLERTQQQLAHAQAEAIRLREEVKELAEELEVQAREADQLRGQVSRAEELRARAAANNRRLAEQPEAALGGAGELGVQGQDADRFRDGQRSPLILRPRPVPMRPAAELQGQTETRAPAPQPDPSLPCPRCGALVVPGAAFCPKCEGNMGYPRADEPYARTTT
jgi:hypothetical protein